MMFHRRYRVLLPLRAAGKLSAGEEAMLERHLRSCAQCRRELDEIMHLQEIMASVSGARAGDPALEGARSQAALTFRQAKHLQDREYRRRFRRERVLPPGVAYAGAGLAILAVGFFGGRLMGLRSAGGDQPAAQAGQIRVMQVSTPHGAPDSVMITYEQVRTVRLRGTLDDPQVTHVLARALINGENAGVRLRALDAVSAADVRGHEREVKAALLLALTTDANDGVRRQALTALVRMPPDGQVRDALLQVLLHDSNPGLRIAAINALDTLRVAPWLSDEGTRSSLQRLVVNDENTYVRAKARSLLEERIQ